MPRPPTEAKQRAISQVDEWMENPPPRLRSWLKREGLPETLGPKIIKITLERKLRKQGLWEHAQKYKVGAARELRDKICPGRSWNIANEIVWRILEEKIEMSKRDILATKNQVSSAQAKLTMPGVPYEILWVYSHPGLCVDVTDPVVAPVIVKWEEDNPCPSQGARNRLNYYQANKSKVSEFFAYVDKLSMEYAKGNLNKPPADPLEDTAEQEAIDDLERQIETDMGAWSDQDDAGD